MVSSDGQPVGLAERFTRLMPAAREAPPVGDFSDWTAIDAWADGIAEQLGGTIGYDAGPVPAEEAVR